MRRRIQQLDFDETITENDPLRITKQQICINVSVTVASHGLQATTDLNRYRPVCLGTWELKADNMGRKSCLLLRLLTD